MPDDALTGARLVEAGARAIFALTDGALPSSLSAEDIARTALGAQAEATGVTAEDLSDAASELSDRAPQTYCNVVAFFRAMAKVLSDE